MAEKEIELLSQQLESLGAKNFDLEAWKSRTLIFLERIFGKESSKIRMVRELKYDYSSWNLRDTAGTGKDKDPVVQKAREILEAAITELRLMGLPPQEAQSNKLLTLLEEELTGKQMREISAILQSGDTDKMERIRALIDTLEKETLTTLIAKLLIH
jgi:hypothetical protein